MSVRAYRILTKEYAENPTWNLWHDDGIMDWLENNGGIVDEAMNQDGAGEIEILTDSLRELCEALEAGEVKQDGKPMEKAQADLLLEGLRADIAEADAKGDKYIAYTCF